MSTTTNNKKKVYSNIEEMKADVEALKQQEYIYDAKFEKSNKPSSGSSKNLVISFVSQLRPGIDATKIQAPIFTIKPKSYLEMTGEYNTPHEFMVKVSKEPLPERRILILTQWLLSNLTITPQKGFERMKPYNPILGEVFVCKWNHEDSTTNLYAEQVCHHPPVSAIYMENRKYNWLYTSTTAPKSTFMGNKVDMTIDGEHAFYLLELGEKYVIEWPPIIARNILLGTSLVEHQDHLRISCEKTGLEAKVEFKKKGNDLDGYIKRDKELVFKIIGNIEGKVSCVDTRTKAQELLFDTKTLPRPDKVVRPVVEQATNESRRVWHHVTFAIYDNDLDLAGKYKNYIEDDQRKIAKARKEKGEKFVPVTFKETEKKIRPEVCVYEYVKADFTPTNTAKQVEEALLDIE